MAVLTTFWSGPTEYLSPDNAILMYVDNLELAYRNEPYYIGGEAFRQYHRWAEISTSTVSERLRWCYNHRDQLPEIGRRARASMFQSFTRDIVAAEVDGRLSQIIRYYLLTVNKHNNPTTISFFEDLLTKSNNDYYKSFP